MDLPFSEAMSLVAAARSPEAAFTSGQFMGLGMTLDWVVRGPVSKRVAALAAEGNCGMKDAICCRKREGSCG